MSLKVRLENAKRDFDWQDLIDLLDDFVREAEKLERDKIAAEESVQQWILLYDIAQKKAKELSEENKRLKGVNNQ